MISIQKLFCGLLALVLAIGFAAIPYNWLLAELPNLVPEATNNEIAIYGMGIFFLAFVIGMLLWMMIFGAMLSLIESGDAVFDEDKLETLTNKGLIWLMVFGVGMFAYKTVNSSDLPPEFAVVIGYHAAEAFIFWVFYTVEIGKQAPTWLKAVGFFWFFIIALGTNFYGPDYGESNPSRLEELGERLSYSAA